MIFLLDANILISAYNYDFPPRKNPGEFWSWFQDCGDEHTLIIPQKVMEEVQRGTDDLHAFLSKMEGVRTESTLSALPYLSRVVTAYGQMDEADLERLDKKADPYIIAHALDLGATVVTNEIPRPGIFTPANKKIPDVCSQLGVSCIRYPRFLWDMRSTGK